MVFPDFGATADLPAFGQATLELTPTAAGEYGFACGMNMIHGVLERQRIGELSSILIPRLMP